MRGFGNRRRLALFACLTWVLAVVGLPALHEAHHDADHTHTAAGTIVHQHDAHGHHVKKAKRNLPRLAIDHPIESGHQAAGVAHHAIALHQALPPALPPVVELEATITPPLLELPRISIGTQPSARGPPTQS